MTEESKIGIFLCHCGTNIAGMVEMEELFDFSSGLKCVKIVKDDKHLCSERGQDLIKDTIKEEGLDRIVVCSCSYTLHEKTFRKTTEEAGLNPYMFQMGNIREGASWISFDVESALRKAKQLVAAAVARVQEHTSLEEKKVEVCPEVLVIGGGIAGMEASRLLANAGLRVYLVEREPSIGGRMAQFDRTFPTLDCAACILTPKMADVGSHPNITIFSWSEVTDIDGSPGNFTVTILRKARGIDSSLCNGCDACFEVCPIKLPNEFDMGLGMRGAIYKPFPQAVPNIAIRDLEHCDDCGQCALVCERDAIDYNSQDHELTIEVGSVIVATGFDQYDIRDLKNYRYGMSENIFTALEFERILNASGPTNGEITLRQNGTFTAKEPSTVGIVHCVGSRDINHNEYCSRVCCMYSLKFAYMIKERLPNADVINFYIDIRAFGKAYEEFYVRVLEKDVIFIRGKLADVEIKQAGTDEEQIILQVEDSLLGKTIRIPVDMLILSPAIVPKQDAREVANLLGVGFSPEGFFQERHPKMAPVNAVADAVFLAGVCLGPKDIPDSIAQAAAAAAEVLALIRNGLTIEPIISSIDETVCSGCMICIELCPYSAINCDPKKKVAVISEEKCKGCGICVSVCPSGAINQDYYSDEAILAEIRGALRVGGG